MFKAGDSGASAIVAGRLDASEVWRRLVSEDAENSHATGQCPFARCRIKGHPTLDRVGSESQRTGPAEAVECDRCEPIDCGAQELSACAASLRYSVAARYFKALVGGYAEVTRWDLKSGELRARYATGGPHISAIAV